MRFFSIQSTQSTMSTIQLRRMRAKSQKQELFACYPQDVVFHFNQPSRKFRLNSLLEFRHCGCAVLTI